MCESRFEDAIRSIGMARAFLVKRKLDSGLARFAKERLVSGNVCATKPCAKWPVRRLRRPDQYPKLHAINHDGLDLRVPSFQPETELFLKSPLPHCEPIITGFGHRSDGDVTRLPL